MGRKNISRVISGFMVFVLVFTLLPLSVLAADGETTSVTVTAVTQKASGTVPLSGAAVSLGDTAVGTTDAAGQVTLTDLTAGDEYTISVQCQGYAPAEKTFTAEADGTVEVALSAYTTVTVTGTVTDKDDSTAVSGAAVTLVYGNGNKETVTDASGAFTFADVYQELVTGVNVSATGYVSQNNITVNFDNSTAISLEKQTYSVTAAKQGEGELSGVPATVKHGDDASVTIKAASNYSIYLIKDNGNTVAADASGKTEYEYKLTDITANHAITVYFTQDVEVLHFWVDDQGLVYQKDEDSEYYQVNTSKFPGLSVKLNKEEDPAEVELSYTPAENYRVSKVTVDNGISEIFTENDQAYPADGTVDSFTLAEDTLREYSIEVMRNQFSIELKLDEAYEDCVVIDPEDGVVDYDRSATLTITPPDGEYLSSLTVNGAAVQVKYNGENLTYLLENVTEDKTVAAVFEAIEVQAHTVTKTVSGDIETPDDAKIENWDVFYLTNLDDNANVTLSVNNAQISRVQNGPFEDSIVISASEAIETLYVLADGVISSSVCNVKVVKDDVLPGISDAERKTHTETKKGFLGIEYTKVVGIDWIISATDNTGGSGIAHVVYSTTEYDRETQSENIRALVVAEQTAVFNEADGTYVASFEENDKKNYYFWAIDMAGNISNCSSYPVNTDTTAPVVSAFSADKIVSYTNGNYAACGVVFTVKCADVGNMSGIATVDLKIGETLFPMTETDTETETESNVGVYTVTVTEPVAGDVSVQVRDDSDATVDENGVIGNVTSVDFIALNSSLTSNYLTVENEAPSISLFEASAVNYNGDGTNWYIHQDTENADVTFTVTIQDVAAGLNTNNIQVSDKNGADVSFEISATVPETIEVTAEDGTTTNVPTGKITGATLLVTVKGEKDKNIKYDLGITLEDAVGNPKKYTSDNYLSLAFAIDGKNPTIEKFDIDGTIAPAGDDKLETDVGATEYGYHFQKDTEITVWAADTGSGISKISFYTQPYGEDPALANSVEALYDRDSKLWYAVFTVEADFKGQIYAYAVDNVSNSCAAGEGETDRHPSQMTTVETQSTHNKTEHITLELPDSVGIDEEKNPIFTMLTTNEDGTTELSKSIEVNVIVTDTFNGISKITYKVIYPGDDPAKVAATEVSLGEGSDWSVAEDGTDANLNTVINGKILLSEESNKITVEVTMYDNAGNRSVKSVVLSIDNTAPRFEVGTHIKPSGNPGENPTEGTPQEILGHTTYFVGHGTSESYAELGGEEGYPIYAGGTLQIKLYERNITKDALLKVANKLLAKENYNKVDQIETVDVSKDIKVFGPYYDNSETGERFDAFYPYTEDVYYIIELRNCTEVARGGTYVTEFTATDKAGLKGDVTEFFVIDDTAPTVTITFDNNDVKNGMYYAADRIATITVVERNFNNESGAINGTASDDGVVFDFPTLSGWTDSGDKMTHTATVSFTSDGLYQGFSATYTDLAARSTTATENTFVVDTVMPEITILGVEDKSANNETVAPAITYTDTNLDLDSVEITLTGANNGVVEYAATITTVHNGQTYIYADFDYEKAVDDIYTLNVYALDLAGNQMTQTIQFSCNRYGSVFDLSNIADMLGKYNQKERTIVVTETNVDAIKPDTVRITLTKNGTPIDLVQGKDFKITEVGGNGTWSQYVYEISADLFKDDGTYNLYFYTEDAAGNINENIDETKEAQISFGIDKTKPIVTPIDLESDTQYAVDGKTVSIEIKDNLLLQDVKIYLNDEEITYIVDGDNYIFDIPKDNAKQTVTIVAVDAAGNKQTIFVEDFLVTTNIFARWFNNTPLFIGSMVALVALLGIAGWRFFIILFWKKDDDEEEEE